MTQPLPAKLSGLAVALCVVLFIAAYVYPIGAIVFASVSSSAPPTDGWSLTSRQWTLLARSVTLAGGGTLLCLALSLPVASVISRIQRLRIGPLLICLMTASVLCSPMVYAFGWQRAWPTISPATADLHSQVRCMVVWALWAWPIPAAIVGAGLARSGHLGYEAALLDTSRLRAFIATMLPVIVRYGALSGLILFVLLLGEYSVPHACGLVVYATELLGWATSSALPIDTAWPSVLPTLIVLAALAIAYCIWRYSQCVDLDDAPPSGPIQSSRIPTMMIVGLFVISFALPIGVLAAQLDGTADVVEAAVVYGWQAMASLALAALAGIASVAMGLWLSPVRRISSACMWISVIVAAMPGALIGRALVAAYLPPVFQPIYDSWIIIVLCYIARFGWIGLVVGMSAARNTPSDLIDQAKLDGASQFAMVGRILGPMHWPVLVCGAAVIAALSVSEIAGSSLVRVPQVNLVAHIIIEKFHRLEDGMLISLSLLLVMVSVLVALAVLVAARGRVSKT